MASPALQAHLDTQARQLGYQDYEHFALHQAQMQQAAHNNGIQGTGYGPGQAQPQQGNWLQNLIAKIPIHPAYLLGKVNDAFTQAGQ